MRRYAGEKLRLMTKCNALFVTHWSTGPNRWMSVEIPADTVLVVMQDTAEDPSSVHAVPENFGEIAQLHLPPLFGILTETTELSEGEYRGYHLVVPLHGPGAPSLQPASQGP